MYCHLATDTPVVNDDRTLSSLDAPLLESPSIPSTEKEHVSCSTPDLPSSLTSSGGHQEPISPAAMSPRADRNSRDPHTVRGDTAAREAGSVDSSPPSQETRREVRSRSSADSMSSDVSEENIRRSAAKRRKVSILGALVECPIAGIKYYDKHICQRVCVYSKTVCINDV